jgi:D-alanine transaminase
MSGFAATAFFNGSFMPLAEVSVSPLDRGFLFADSVYEVIPAYAGRLFRLAEHLQRLDSSLAEIALPAPYDPSGWSSMLAELVRRNGADDLAVYLQVTRGAPSVRDHGFPPESTAPTIFAMTTPLKPLADEILHLGIAAVTQEDIRWGGCHIKSTALLANVLARQQAVRRGATDALLVRDGRLTEGTAANVFLVHEDMLLTPPKSPRILPGITRDLVLELAADHGIAFGEQELPLELLERASEVWLTSSTREIVPVTRIDNIPVGDGKPGPLWHRMRALYETAKRRHVSAPATTGG